MRGETFLALEAFELDRAGTAPLATRPKAPRHLRRLLREPLVHFFAAGALLFALAEHHRAQSDIYRIVVTPQRVREISDNYKAEYGAPPPAATLARLIDQDVDEEVLYREGELRGLDRDDEIVRRRIVQKMRFLEQDLTAPREPTEAQIEAYYAA